MTFQSQVMHHLITRDYSLRLVRGRREMILPSHLLSAFVNNQTFLSWYDPCLPEIPDEGLDEVDDVISQK